MNFNNIKNIFLILSPGQKKKLPILLIIIFISSLFEVGGLTSVVPFLLIVANPEVAQTNKYIVFVFEILGFQKIENITYYFGVFALTLISISTCIRAYANYAQAKFSYEGQHYFSLHLLINYLDRDFLWHKNHNSSDLGKDIIAESGTAMAYGLIPLLVLINNIFLILLLMAVLLIVSPMTTVTILVLIVTKSIHYPV